MENHRRGRTSHHEPVGFGELGWAGGSDIFSGLDMDEDDDYKTQNTGSEKGLRRRGRHLEELSLPPDEVPALGRKGRGLSGDGGGAPWYRVGEISARIFSPAMAVMRKGGTCSWV
ncbi:hypothetical protein AC579_5683 [Pseudocercospora musae]|uniref:Uncharacterized protein n=1 Tax=Pseudocercospora musae TaxID=113226 RepID=A0A139HCL5_9PEZI|nr:hypothetical protein AC579_5683 [Pseudocercospora musae]